MKLQKTSPSCSVMCSLFSLRTRAKARNTWRGFTSRLSTSCLMRLAHSCHFGNSVSTGPIIFLVGKFLLANKSYQNKLTVAMYICMLVQKRFCWKGFLPIEPIMVSFLHAADLHLGMRVTRFNPEISDRIREARFVALDNILRKGIELQADFLIIAGDLFDDLEVDKLT